MRRRIQLGLIIVGLLSAVGLLLTGCAGVGSFAGLNKDQIEALAKIKDAAAVCVKASAGGVYTGVAIFSSIDKGIYGTITVKDDCSTTLGTVQPVPAKPTP